VLVFRCDWGALGLAICPDQFGQGVAHFSGHRFDLGAGFRLLPILECGNRLGDVLEAFSSARRATVPRDRNQPLMRPLS
jgi:hypothetical protein